ncbi:MAG: ABC transporter substrate-binding protein, partial [Bacteroidia bacterium]|nr:ABC transporter substrate-binding protein [Bacteroidia bacterium]MDW8334539.1 ABC transporter substrate-binding protein [Bacteroidia bacterium]
MERRQQFRRPKSSGNAVTTVVAWASAALAACSSPQDGAYHSDQTTPAKGDWVVVALQSEPVNLSPLAYADEPSFMAVRLLYQRLLELSPKGERFTPSLALRFPEISPDGKTYHFEINPRADWNDEYPITGADVAFSLKLLFCPQISAPHRKVYFEKIESIEVSSENPKKFSVRFKEKYAYALAGLGFELWILPEYLFDPQGTLRKYSLQELAAGKVKDEAVAALAEKLNSAQFWRNPKADYGSGPYFLKSWDAGREVVLERKKYWWGAREPDNPALQVFPNRIVYRIIADETSALNALKNQEIDVLRSIPYRAFETLKNDSKILRHYQLSTPPIYAYNYIGMNNRPGPGLKPLFTDAQTRKAMAHLVDLNALVEHVYRGLARPMVGPVYPMLKDIFDEKLRPVPFSLDSAATLLERAGWKKEGDVLVRNGVRFETEFYYRQGNETGRIVGAM